MPTEYAINARTLPFLLSPEGDSAALLTMKLLEHPDTRSEDLLAGLRRAYTSEQAGAILSLAMVLLLHRFYTLLATGMPAVDALRRSAAWLRTLPQAEALALWPALCAWLPTGKPEFAFLRDTLERRLRATDCPFAAPEYWAGFTYTGPG